jgi:hypothetical protein
VLHATLLRQPPHDDRGAERYRIRSGAVRRDHGSDISPITILEVSTSGFLLETEQPLVAGSTIMVELTENLCREASVVWQSGRFHGAQFAQHLSPQELKHILAASPVVWPNFGNEGAGGSFARGTTQSKQPIYDTEVPDEEKLPFGTRLRIIVGTTAALWAMIIAVGWAVTS